MLSVDLHDFLFTFTGEYAPIEEQRTWQLSPGVAYINISLQKGNPMQTKTLIIATAASIVFGGAAIAGDAKGPTLISDAELSSIVAGATTLAVYPADMSQDTGVDFGQFSGAASRHCCEGTAEVPEGYEVGNAGAGIILLFEDPDPEPF